LDVWGEEALEAEFLAFGDGEGGAFAELGVFEEDGALEVVLLVWRFGGVWGDWFLLTVREHSRGPEVARGKWLNLCEAMIVVFWWL
jgi:hypothetical protein